MKSIPLYEDIYQKILGDISKGVLMPGDQLPTEKELAKTFKVSRITVQKAVNLLASEKLVYRIVGKGTFVTGESQYEEPGKSVLVGLLLSDVSSVYGLGILKAFERRASQLNCNVVFKNSYGDKELERKAILQLKALNVDGYAIQPVLKENYSLEIVNMVVRQIPVVLVDRNMKGISVSFVGSDNESVIMNIMQRIFDSGHSVVSLISAESPDTSSLEERMQGFNAAYARSNKLNPMCNLTIRSDNADFENGTVDKLAKDRDRIKEHLRRFPAVTCVLTSEYFISVLVRQAAEELGRRIPEDLSLVTFDSLPDGGVSCIRQNQERIGVLAAEQLLKLVNKSTNHTKIYCDAQFVDNGTLRNRND